MSTHSLQKGIAFHSRFVFVETAIACQCILIQKFQIIKNGRYTLFLT